MSRDLHANFLSLLDDDVIRPVMCVYLGFDSPLAMCTSAVTQSFGGVSYAGAGTLLSISSSKENTDLGTSGLTLSLSGCAPYIVERMRDTDFQGNPVEIYLALAQESGYVSSSTRATPFFKGFMDNATYVQNGDTITITLSVENHLARLSRTNLRLYTQEDQQLNHGQSDIGLNYVESIAEQKLVWGV